MADEKKQLIIPKHIAIIMDGNGRWAKKRFMPRNIGHRQGGKVVEQICKDAYDLGVKYLTVYAFSTENWTRPTSEIETLMNLLREYMNTCLDSSKKNNMRVRVIGDKSKLDEDLQQKIETLEETSKDYTGLNFQVALNYGGRDEILRTTKEIAMRFKNSEISLEELDEAMYEEFLDTRGIPSPDLVIRTSGEQRLSNFLLWQVAYSEFYYPSVLWPDFNKAELIKSIEYFNKRERRYGGV